MVRCGRIGSVKAIHSAPHHPAAAASGRRFRPAGLLTSGGRLTLLILVTGLVLLAQAWQAAHRYGQHTAARMEAPVPAAVLRPPANPFVPPPSTIPPASTSYESSPDFPR